jgi:transcriptional regulator with XRE-family HTH domain
MSTKKHLGDLARELRQAAGLTRRQLAEAVGLSDLTILNFELARRLPTRDTLNRLLAHPALAQLVERALAQGVAVRLRPDPPADVDVVAVLIRRRS